MNYLMVLPVTFYRIDSQTIACGSAFAKHLRELVPKAKFWADKIVILSPTMSHEEYIQNQGQLEHITCEKESIHHLKAFSSDIGRVKYFLTSPFTVWPKIWKAVRKARVVHSGPSQDFLKSFEIIAIIFANLQKVKTVFVKDIDHRASTRMLNKLNKLSLKSYLLRICLYDPFVDMQMKYASNNCSLLLLKGHSMVNDYGKGKDNVKNFYDTVHSSEHVLNDKMLQSKLTKVVSHKKDIRLVYFGRLVEYKGIIDMIHTVKALKNICAHDNEISSASLTIIGSGPQKSKLIEIVQHLDLEDSVYFKDAMKYGRSLFTDLINYDFLLAAPMSEDTPRSAFDAMACGLPILAYDTYYYKDLEKTGAVKTSQWMSISKLASLVVEIKKDTESHKNMIVSGVEFAKNNTQKIWLEKRHSWQVQFL